MQIIDNIKKALIKVEPVGEMQVEPYMVDSQSSVELFQTINELARSGKTGDELNELLKLYKEMMAIKAEQEFRIAKQFFQSNCPPIKRTRTGGDPQKFTWKYAPLEEIGPTIAPHLAQSGLSYAWDPQHEDGYVVSKCILSHVAGHSEHAVFRAPIDMKLTDIINDMQRVAGAETFANRRSLIAVAGLTTTDEDMDGQHTTDKNKGRPKNQNEIETLSNDELANIECMIDEIHSEQADRMKLVKSICNMFGVMEMSTIPSQYYNKVVNKLQATKKASS